MTQLGADLRRAYDGAAGRQDSSDNREARRASKLASGWGLKSGEGES